MMIALLAITKVELMRRFWTGQCVAITLVVAFASNAGAAAFPTRPIRLIVPFAAGGPTDTIARQLARTLADASGTPVVVDNRPGASGTLAATIVASAKPDGHTLIMVSSSYAVLPVFSKLPYDPVRNIQPISQLAEGPFVIIVNRSIRVTNINQLIALANANPGSLRSSSGSGITYLATELFNLESKIKLTNVPYKGNGPALRALMTGEAQLFFSPITIALQHINAGKVRGIAVTTKRRSSALPDLPTVSESGLPTYEASLWYAVLGPQGLRENTIHRLNLDIVKAVNTNDMRSRLLSEGFEPVGSTPDQLRELLGRNMARWAEVKKSSNIICPVWPFC